MRLFVSKFIFNSVNNQREAFFDKYCMALNNNI